MLREKFARLQKLMGMLQSEVDNVENGEPIDSNPQQHMQGLRAATATTPFQFD